MMVVHIIYLYDDDECEPSFHCFPNKNHHKYQWDADDNRHGSEAGDDEADDNGHDDDDDDGHYGEADDDGHDDDGHDDDGHDDEQNHCMRVDGAWGMATVSSVGFTSG